MVLFHWPESWGPSEAGRVLVPGMQRCFLEKGARTEALESDAEKLSSTDNEDEELVTEGGEAGPAPCPHSGWSLACLLVSGSQ